MLSLANTMGKGVLQIWLFNFSFCPTSGLQKYVRASFTYTYHIEFLLYVQLFTSTK